MPLFDLGINPILQETCDTCGPAVTRMMLAGMRLNDVPESDLGNSFLLFMQQHPNDCFFASPEALAEVLTNLTGRKFQAVRRQTAQEINQFLVNVILDHGIPVPLLVKTCAHWMVASGFAGMVTQSEALVSDFVVDDPFDFCRDCNHNNMVTPFCSGGGFNGLVFDKIPAAAWREWWLTPCECNDERQCVCVVPADAGDGPRTVTDLEDAGPPGLPRPISAGDLNVCLEWAKSVYRLEVHGAFRNSLRGAVVRKAMPVSSKGGDYYLTEVGRREGVTALFLFDWRNGSLLGARALEVPIAQFLPELDQIKEGIELGRRRENIVVAVEEQVDEGTPLIWNPTREFRSPYFPYFVVGEGEAGVSAVGVNRAFYPQVHEGLA